MGNAALDISSIDSLADALSEDVREGDKICEMPVGDLQKGQYQPREEIKASDLKSLVESIKAQGVLLPLLIRPLPDESHEIVAGERRWRAASLAGLETVPCIIREIDDETALAAALVENIDREDFTLVEEAIGVDRLVKRTSSKKAAGILGKSAQWVSKRCKIANAPDYIIAFAKLGFSTDVEGLYQLSRLAGKDEKAAKNLVDLWTKDPTSRASLRQQVLNILSPKKPVTQKQQPLPEESASVEASAPVAPIASGNDNVKNSNAPSDESGSIAAPSRSTNTGPSESKQTKSLPPIIIHSASTAEGFLVCETNEGVIRFELSGGAKSSIMKALKTL